MEFFTDPSGSPFLYPAPAAVVYKVFFLSTRHALEAFLGFFIACVAAAGTLYSHVLQRRSIATVLAYLFSFVVLLASFPLWSDFKQGNIEIVICLLATLGIVCFVCGHDYAAAVCFGLAGSLKIYPLMLLGLLLARKQFRQVAVTLSVFVVSTLVSLWLVCPSIPTSWHYISMGLRSFRSLYMLTLRPEIGTDHSLFALEKLLLRRLPPPEELSRYLTLYMVALTIGGTALFFLRIRTLPVINQVISLTCASVLLPPVSYEYTLIQLTAPLGLVLLLTVDAHRAARGVPGLPVMLGCFVVLWAPLPELIWHGRTVDGQVKSIALIVLFILALWRPLSDDQEVPYPL